MIETNRVTAGLPGLTPQIRQVRTVREETDAFQAAAAREALLRDEATFERDGDSDVTDLHEQMGRPLSAAEFISRLKQLNPDLIFERSIQYPELTGIYVSRRVRNLTGGFEQQKQHVCGMPSPPQVMPEFSVRHYHWKETINPEDKYEVIKTREFEDETRGWRTVLMRLIKARLVGREAAERKFAVSLGRSSRNWQEQLN